jgi:MarR family 2-MHQ and catechol resistance regulon transcriptional repressor
MTGDAMTGVKEPWDDPRITAFGMVLEATASLLTQVERDLGATIGIPFTWFGVLLRLARSPEHKLRMTDLAAQIGLSTSGLTRLVDRVEAAGYVRREACPSDRRSAYAVLTEEGEQIVRAAVPPHLESIQSHLAGPLGPQLTELEDLLRIIRDHNGPGACPA